MLTDNSSELYFATDASLINMNENESLHNIHLYPTKEMALENPMTDGRKCLVIVDADKMRSKDVSVKSAGYNEWIADLITDDMFKEVIIKARA